MDKFWEALGGKIAERWLAALVPALMFWLGGFVAWAYTHGGVPGLGGPAEWVGRQPTLTQVLLIVFALVVVAASGLLVARLTEPALHLVEGYWPRWMSRTWRWLAATLPSRADKRDARWQELRRMIDEDGSTLTPEDYTEFLGLDRRQRRQPALAYRLMPTRVGNILRSAESWPYDKYGLETVAVWPHMWLVLPNATKQEITAARSAMDATVSAALWGLLFIGFSVLTPWAALIGAAVVVLALRTWLPARAEVFGDLIEASFDLHRTALYQQLRWPLPKTPDAERAEGLEITKYLWRGSDSLYPSFTEAT